MDLICNEEAKNIAFVRPKIIRAIQEFMDNEGYVEVETPILTNLLTGASARPFITHHNTLDIDNAPSAVITNLIQQDDDGTYFRNMITDEKTMLYSENRTEYYTLLLTFPVDYKDSIYSGIPELIEINILSRQILDSDN